MWKMDTQHHVNHRQNQQHAIWLLAASWTIGGAFWILSQWIILKHMWLKLMNNVSIPAAFWFYHFHWDLITYYIVIYVSLPPDSVCEDIMFSGCLSGPFPRLLVHPVRYCYPNVSWMPWTHTDDLIRFLRSKVCSQQAIKVAKASTLTLGVEVRLAGMHNLLHWLSYPQWIMWWQGCAPEYLSRLCVLNASILGCSRLRLADENQLLVPKSSLHLVQIHGSLCHLNCIIHLCRWTVSNVHWRPFCTVCRLVFLSPRRLCDDVCELCVF